MDIDQIYGDHLTVYFLLSSCCHVQLFVTLWTAVHQAFLSFTISWSLLKLKSFELMMPSNHLILCHPLFLLSSILRSIRVFSNESALHIRWPKNCSSSSNPSNEYSELISIRIDQFDLPVVKKLSRVSFSTTMQKHVLYLFTVRIGKTICHSQCI